MTPSSAGHTARRHPLRVANIPGSQGASRSSTALRVRSAAPGWTPRMDSRGTRRYSDRERRAGQRASRSATEDLLRLSAGRAPQRAPTGTTTVQAESTCTSRPITTPPDPHIPGGDLVIRAPDVQPQRYGHIGDRQRLTVHCTPSGLRVSECLVRPVPGPAASSPLAHPPRNPHRISILRLRASAAESRRGPSTTSTRLNGLTLS